MKKDFALKLLEMLIDSDCGKNESTSSATSLIGSGVIVRCRDAGVHYGKLVSYEDRMVELKDCRRMWRWWAATESTLSAVAKYGINQSKSNIQCMLDRIILLDACEIIPIYGEAERSILTAENYNEQ